MSVKKWKRTEPSDSEVIMNAGVLSQQTEGDNETEIPIAGLESENEVEGVKRGWLYSGILSGLTSTTRAVAGEETERALTQILELLDGFFAEHNQRYSVDAFLSLILLAIYYKTPRVKIDIIIDNEETIRNAHHYYKFAAAAYGWKLLNGLMFDDTDSQIIRGFVTGDQQNNISLCRHTGIKEEDIISTNWTSRDFHPAHYIAVDHRTESIVFAIRGTFHIKDALTDLIAHSVDFQTGQAHGGILKCATKKLPVVKRYILDATQQYTGYKLVIVGHSLGAGTAAIITLLLKQEYPHMDIHCYAYAPPCILDLPLANQCRSFISSFVLENDLVPRLSYGSMEYLKQCTISLMGQSTSNVHRLVQAMAAGGAYSEGISKSVAGALHYESHELNADEFHENRPKMTLEDKLYPPGSVYLLQKEKPEDLTDPSYRMEYSDCIAYAEIIVSKTMFSDHMPNAYNKALNGVLHHQSLVRHGILPMPEHEQFDIYPVK